MLFLRSRIFSRRQPFAIIALLCIGLLSFGYFLQFYAAQEPCPLCIFQRLAYMGITLVALIAAAHGARLTGATVYYTLIALIALLGSMIAGRQTWLQHLPEDLIPECGPGLDFMLETFPLGETIRKVFQGSGECAKVDWMFLGLSIAEWSLLCFFGIAVSSIALLLLRAAQRPVRMRHRKHRRYTE